MAVKETVPVALIFAPSTMLPLVAAPDMPKVRLVVFTGPATVIFAPAAALSSNVNVSACDAARDTGVLSTMSAAPVVFTDSVFAFVEMIPVVPFVIPPEPAARLTIAACTELESIVRVPLPEPALNVNVPVGAMERVFVAGIVNPLAPVMLTMLPPVMLPGSVMVPRASTVRVLVPRVKVWPAAV